MFPTQFYDPKVFVQAVIEDCQLGEVPPQVLEKLEEAIEVRMSDRITLTIFDHLRKEDVETIRNLRVDDPELDEIDAIMMVAPTLPHIQKKLEKNLRDLYEELTYDAAQIDKNMKLNQQEEALTRL